MAEEINRTVPFIALRIIPFIEFTENMLHYLEMIGEIVCKIGGSETIGLAFWFEQFFSQRSLLVFSAVKVADMTPVLIVPQI